MKNDQTTRENWISWVAILFVCAFASIVAAGAKNSRPADVAQAQERFLALHYNDLCGGVGAYPPSGTFPLCATLVRVEYDALHKYQTDYYLIGPVKLWKANSIHIFADRSTPGTIPDGCWAPEYAVGYTCTFYTSKGSEGSHSLTFHLDRG